MDTVKVLVDSLKITTYEVLAVLLPGAALVLAWRICWQRELPAPITPLAFVGISYVIGIGIQGVSSFFTNLRRPPKNPALDEARELARAAALQLGIKADNDEALLSICLSHVQDRRQSYDRFVALADMARGLACANLLLVAVVVITGKPTWTLFATVLCLAALEVGLIERYRRFSPLSQLAVFGSFIATQTKRPVA